MHFQVRSAGKNVPELIAADGLGQKPYFCNVFVGHFLNIFINLALKKIVPSVDFVRSATYGAVSSHSR